MHWLSGSCATLPQQPAAYRAWFEDNLVMCVEYFEKVVQIRKVLLSYIPLRETVCKFDPPQSVDLTQEAPLLPTPYTEISLRKSRELAVSQLELSQLEGLLVIFRGLHVSSGSSYAVHSQLNVVEKYLEVTKPSPEVVLDSFRIPGSFKSAAMLGQAAHILRGTDKALETRLSKQSPLHFCFELNMCLLCQSSLSSL